MCHGLAIATRSLLAPPVGSIYFSLTPEHEDRATSSCHCLLTRVLWMRQRHNIRQKVFLNNKYSNFSYILPTIRVVLTYSSSCETLHCHAQGATHLYNTVLLYTSSNSLPSPTFLAYAISSPRSRGHGTHLCPAPRQSTYLISFSDSNMGLILITAWSIPSLNPRTFDDRSTPYTTVAFRAYRITAPPIQYPLRAFFRITYILTSLTHC
jgi:hypothetical protein